jgi:hypothetical protein
MKRKGSTTGSWRYSASCRCFFRRLQAGTAATDCFRIRSARIILALNGTPECVLNCKETEQHFLREIALQKRTFVFTALSIAAAPALARKKPSAPQASGPTLLTISGAIGGGNRGPLDPALDQMMHKQSVRFERAYVYNFATLSALSAVEITPTLEYDAKRHALRGPLLSDVIAAAADGPVPESATVKLRGVDGYVVQVAMEDLRKYRFIVATHIDKQPIPLGGLGPLWAVYDADRFPKMAALPLSARFTQCPWGLYHIELQIAGK